MIWRLSILIFYFAFSMFALLGQPCTPAPSERCDSAKLLCSLSELYGYYCTIRSFNYTYRPYACTPLCPSGGAPSNTEWWAFMTSGGDFQILIYVDNSFGNGSGLQMGIWGDCSCMESISCYPYAIAPRSTYTISGTLEPCKTYYLFVDGYNNDVCDFYLETVGGDYPIIWGSSGKIMGQGEVCASDWEWRYSYDVYADCEPNFVWTLDGNQLPSRKKDISFHFEKKGDFILCATAYIGNPEAGAFCDQIGPECLTIKVNGPKEVEAEEVLCFETAQNYRWRRNCFIDRAGRVICRGKEKNGCYVDTIVNFIKLDKPESPEVCYLAAHPDDVYKDSLTGKEYKGCHYQTNVNLPRSTDPYRCDSSYRLNMYLPEYAGQIRNYRAWGRSYLELRTWDISKTCGNSGIREEFIYSWYRKSDPLRRSLGRSDILQVNGQDTFCVDLSVKVDFCNVNKTYHFTFCANDSKGPKIGTKDSPFPDTTRWGFRDDSEDIGRIQLLLSTLSENKDEFVIHPMPNPSSTDHRIRLHSTLPIDEIILEDMSGRIVWTQKSENSESLQMNLEVNLAPGIYQLIGFSSHFKSLSRIVVFP